MRGRCRLRPAPVRWHGAVDGNARLLPIAERRGRQPNNLRLLLLSEVRKRSGREAGPVVESGGKALLTHLWDGICPHMGSLRGHLVLLEVMGGSDRVDSGGGNSGVCWRDARAIAGFEDAHVFGEDTAGLAHVGLLVEHGGGTSFDCEAGFEVDAFGDYKLNAMGVRTRSMDMNSSMWRRYDSDSSGALRATTAATLTAEVLRKFPGFAVITPLLLLTSLQDITLFLLAIAQTLLIGVRRLLGSKQAHRS